MNAAKGIEYLVGWRQASVVRNILQNACLARTLQQLGVPALQLPLIGNELVSGAIVEHVVCVGVIWIGLVGRHDPDPQLSEAS